MVPSSLVILLTRRTLATQLHRVSGSSFTTLHFYRFQTSGIFRFKTEGNPRSVRSMTNKKKALDPAPRPTRRNMKLKIALFVTAGLALLCLVPAPAAHAQNLYAALHGTVTDASGAVVPNATITVVNTSTNIKTMASTDSQGYYTVPQLQVGGPYSVTVAANGFQSFTTTGLNLSVNDNRQVDAKLQVGSSDTT